MIAVPAAPLAPDEAARRAAAEPGAFWLSAPAPDEVGIARDMVGAAPVDVVRGDGPADLARVERAWADARAAWGASGAPAVAGIPALVGWFSYDLGRAFIGLPARAGGDQAWPLVEVHSHDAVWVRDAGGAATIFAHDAAAARRLEERLSRPARAVRVRIGALAADHGDDLFLSGVERILEYLRAGDAYQVNLSRRLSAACAPGAAAPVALAAALRARAPAPHAALIASVDGEGALVGNSPERFLAVTADGAIETRPIKGTRSRGETPDADRAAAAALAASPKDRAEHVMIVDLERNDLGRVCQTGSVGVGSLARVVALPTVFHMVSTVHGRLRPDIGLSALLEATFPGGSVTGAPKISALDHIAAFEPVGRGASMGALGRVWPNGDVELALTIRTFAVADGRIHLWVGGGVVWDSDPQEEIEESWVKARPLLTAVGAPVEEPAAT